jgi:hypothetical protein
MSRFEIYHEDKGLAFGYDHACGEYLQIWRIPEDPEDQKLQWQFGPDPDEMLVNEDRFTNFNRDKMELLIKEHGFDLSELEAESMENPSLWEILL